MKYDKGMKDKRTEDKRIDNKMKSGKRIWSIFFVICVLILGQYISEEEFGQCITKAGLGESNIVRNLNRKAVAKTKKVCTVNGTVELDGTDVKIKYNGKTIGSAKTPIVEYQGMYMIAFEPMLSKKGPGISFEHNLRNAHTTLIWQDHVVTFFTEDRVMYASGQMVGMDVPIMEGQFQETGKTYLLAPMEPLCQALGFTCSWNEKKTVYNIKSEKEVITAEKTQTQYAYSKKDYVAKQYRRYSAVSPSEYRRLVSKSGDTTKGFQFLRLDEYREVDEHRFKEYYQYLIEDYCRQNNLAYTKSKLYKKADIFLKAAKKYNIDPVYFACQTFQESAYGTSRLARGVTIQRVAYKNFSMSGGKLKTKALSSKVKVYNLYGIKAYDTDPVVGATSYAYYQGWTSVNAAIYGAAQYLTENYIAGKYKQNTLFKMRYTYRKALWHQYAMDPYYAANIGIRIYYMRCCYAEESKLTFDYPKYNG